MARSESQGFQDLFLDGLKDILYAEKKILKTLPKMARSASDEAVSQHREQTESHVERLEKVSSMLGKAPRGKTCPAIDGIIEEGSEMMEEYEGTHAIDAGLVAAAQAVEHYEMARYRTLSAWAEELKMPDAAKLLKATLDEEARPTQRSPSSPKAMPTSARWSRKLPNPAAVSRLSQWRLLTAFRLGRGI